IIAPSGGFWPAGSSLGNGVSEFISQRTRYVEPGLYNIAFCFTTSALICRNGVILSNIQKERPCVATIRSLSFIVKSRIDVAGIFNRNDCQCSPSSKDTSVFVSEPANNKPLRMGSSFTTFIGSSGNPFTISFHVLPPSVVL